MLFRSVLNRLVALAGKMINGIDLERERMGLEHTVTLLRAEQVQLEDSVQELKNQRDTRHPQVAQ